MTVKFYVDADSLVYKAVYKATKEAEVKSRLNKMVKTVIDSVGALAEMLGYTESLEGKIAVKGDDNFRNDISPIYKAHRKARIVEPLEKELMEMSYKHMIKYWKAVQSHGVEADDLVVTWNHKDPGIIVGIDKDLLQSPGLHFNPDKNILKEITEDQAAYTLHKQLLTGDSGDNIKGIPGIGPKKAEAFLKGIKTDKQLKKVREIWKKEYGRGWEQELQLTADLIYLQRHPGDKYDTTL